MRNEALSRVTSSRDVGSFVKRCQSARDHCCHHDGDGDGDDDDDDGDDDDEDDDSDAKFVSSGVGCAAAVGGLSKNAEAEADERDCKLR